MSNELDADLLDWTAQIVSAYVGNNSLPVGAIPELISSVFSSLTATGHLAADIETSSKPVPAMSVKASVKPDNIGCLHCAKRFKTLKRHLSSDHGQTVEEYKATFGLPESYPVTASSYSERRSLLAKEIGLGNRTSGKVAASAANPSKVVASARAAAAAAKAAGEPKKPARRGRPKKIAA